MTHQSTSQINTVIELDWKRKRGKEIDNINSLVI